MREDFFTGLHAALGYIRLKGNIDGYRHKH